VSALNQNSTADLATYNFLHTTNELTETFPDAGDVKVEELSYWNTSDPDASAQGAKLYGYGLVHYCLVHGDFYGTAWKDPDVNAEATAITKVVDIMSKASSLVSDISAQIGAMFTFKAPPQAGKAVAPAYTGAAK